jgi:hypothetical protein
VWSIVVPLSHQNNNLRQGAGVEVPLTPKRNFRRRPHLNHRQALMPTEPAYGLLLDASDGLANLAPNVATT